MNKLFKAVLFKAVCLALIAAVTTAAFTGCITSPYTIFKRATGVSVPECGSVTTVDTTGWMGDGELLFCFYLEKPDGQKFESKLKDAEYWQSLPMDTKLSALVYEHCGADLPVVNGYYYFYDEQTNVHHYHDDIDEAYSYDYILAMYDSESYTAYYYEYHS